MLLPSLTASIKFSNHHSITCLTLEACSIIVEVLKYSIKGHTVHSILESAVFVLQDLLIPIICLKLVPSIY